jgi:hypothetical protein
MRMRGIIIGVAIGTAVGATAARIGRWRQTWGIEPGEGARPLAGDDIVASPTAIETRGIDIDAPPEAVWPWLVQMGYGRAGWYSYDQLDQRGRSADGLIDAWQTLAVGDIVPTHPGGGFEVAVLDPGRALVLRSDTALVTAQADAAKAAGAGLDAATTGVRMSGAMLSGTPQGFAASWALVLEPIDGGRTRFIERFRVWFDASTPTSGLVMPFLGFGVFVMLQKQMVGIRERAEGRGRSRPIRIELPTAVRAISDVVETIPDATASPEPVATR